MSTKLKTPQFVGFKKRIDEVQDREIMKIANSFDRDAVLAKLLEKLDQSYTLFYADYRDQFDIDDIAKMINSHDSCPLEESLWEWLDDCRWRSAEYAIKEAYDEDELAIMDALDLRHKIRDEIQQRDDSNPVKDILCNSSSVFCFVPITHAEPQDSEDTQVLTSYQYISDDKELIEQYKIIAKASGLDLKKDKKKITELYHNGASFSMSPLVWFFSLSPRDYYKALMKQYKEGKDDILVTLHSPALAIRDQWNGAGHCIDTDRIVTVPLSSIKCDEKGNGYSFGIDVCGMSHAPFECGFTF